MLYVNSPIPAIETLRAEGLDVVVGRPSGVPRIGLLNLMPEKVATEHDYCRMLAHSGRTLSLVLLRLPGQFTRPHRRSTSKRTTKCWISMVKRRIWTD